MMLAYGLARLSDTVADAPPPFAPARSSLLTQWQENPWSVQGSEPGFPETARPAEKALWQAWPALRATLRVSPAREEILGVWGRILQGQQHDVQRTLHGCAHHPLEWPELIEYADQVAGCVGVFWHRLGKLLLPPWSLASEEFLSSAGRAYGQALQLINICRDAADDAQAGRCYLRAADRPLALEAIRAGLEQGRRVAAALVSRRARLATALPGTLADELWPALAKGQPVRLTRHQIYRCLARELWRSLILPARSPGSPF